MAATTVYAADYNQKVLRTPEGGNGFNESYKYTHAAPLVESGSTINYGIIPAGVEINAVKLNTDGSGHSEKLGYSPVDSANGPSAVLDYWFAATTLGTDGTAKSIVSIAMPIVFEFPVKLVGTTSAATADASITNVVIGGKVVGVK